jgi:uncharacterized protein (DUF849 family)
VTVDELARDAAACVAAGAGAIHMHPRDEAGRETFAVDDCVRAVREACGVPVGVSTGAWIEPDLDRRIALLAKWTEPDYASVNVSEDGFERVMRTLTERGIGIEAGVWSVDDAGRLTASGIEVLRILVEPVDARDLTIVHEIHAALDAGGATAPRLQHGDGAATWLLLDDAIARGLDTRIGLEDTIHDRDGAVTAGNATLVSQCRR